MSTPSFGDHFRAIASRYQDVRSLDARAVRRIAKAVARVRAPVGGLRLLDVGTGTGRYVEAVRAEVERRGVAIARAVGADASPDMLHRLAGHPGVAARAEALPFAAGSFDAVLSFNALHHLTLDAFLAEAARVLAPRGRLVIYTRSPEQNARTIWGMHFPDFAARETRLYARAEIQAALARSGAFTRVRLRILAWWQLASLPTLLRQARARHYSTFRYYGADEFEAALATFRGRVLATYAHPWAIPIRNDHLIAVARRRA
jgi:ubiquinone/menaquinone biosynthesis C-methylase UbiE